MADTFVPAVHRTTIARTSIRRTNAPRQSLCLGSLRDMVETWEERKRFRLKLQDMLITAPHMIADVGLTRKQVEAEIAKPFWRG
ncbi:MULTISPECIES: DUF1127 domain-containing protein [unclassified Mesorhizobium]|uniref:DUF1127 domain-containing protein n=1 Tax=unclassified Mesorhizobium TaxID=325217 RepID=UPI000A4F9BE5|nr:MULTISPECIES: DUF1127 domain-containing protein [unclassified Mesorhizobium]